MALVVCKRTGKVRFRDKLDAEIFLSIATSKNSNRRQETRVYFCKHCSGYHVTSQSMRTEKRGKE